MASIHVKHISGHLILEASSACRVRESDISHAARERPGEISPFPRQTPWRAVAIFQVSKCPQSRCEKVVCPARDGVKINGQFFLYAWLVSDSLTFEACCSLNPHLCGTRLAGVNYVSKVKHLAVAGSHPESQILQEWFGSNNLPRQRMLSGKHVPVRAPLATPSGTILPYV